MQMPAVWAPTRGAQCEAPRFVLLLIAAVVPLMLAACSSANHPGSAPAVTPVAVTSSAASTPMMDRSPNAEPVTFTDPSKYCSAVGTVDAPDNRWAGVRVPPAIIDPVRARYGAFAKVDDATVVWRCMSGKVMRCFSWGTHYCGIQDDSTVPPSPVVEYCQREKDTHNAGGRATMGYATVYWWGCKGGG